MTFLDEIELLGRLGPIKLSILVTHKGKRVIGNFVTLASRRMVTPLTESRLLEVRHLKKSKVVKSSLYTVKVKHLWVTAVVKLDRPLDIWV